MENILILPNQSYFKTSSTCINRLSITDGIYNSFGDGNEVRGPSAAQERKFSIKDFFSKCDQIRTFT